MSGAGFLARTWSPQAITSNIVQPACAERGLAAARRCWRPWSCWRWRAGSRRCSASSMSRCDAFAQRHRAVVDDRAVEPRLLGVDVGHAARAGGGVRPARSGQRVDVVRRCAPCRRSTFSSSRYSAGLPVPAQAEALEGQVEGGAVRFLGVGQRAVDVEDQGFDDHAVLLRRQAAPNTRLARMSSACKVLSCSRVERRRRRRTGASRGAAGCGRARCASSVRWRSAAARGAGAGSARRRRRASASKR